MSALYRSETDPFLRLCCDASAPDAEARLVEARRRIAATPGLLTSDLFVAAATGHVETIEAILRDAPTLARRPGGHLAAPPLLYLAFSVFQLDGPRRQTLLTRCAAELLRHGTDPTAMLGGPGSSESDASSPRTALDGALGVFRNLELAALLIDHGARDPSGFCLLRAIGRGDWAATAMLLVDPLLVGGDAANRAFLELFRHDEPELLALFLERGFDPNEISAGPSGTALHLAVEHGRSLAVIEQLLAAGADVERTRPDGRSAYALAIRLGRDELAEKLRASGASIEVAPTDRLLAALLARDEATARQLLGRDPSLRARVGADELDVVIDRVEAGDPDLAHRFVGLGFDPNQRGARQRRTLLHSAAILGDPALCAWLVTHRAAVDPTDHRGRTPLGLAVWAALATSSARHIATLDQLLQDGADPNELGTGWPLRIATYRRDLVLVDRLLRAGASPTLRARSGESAVSIARQLDLWELVGRFEGFPNSTSGPNDPTETS